MTAREKSSAVNLLLFLGFIFAVSILLCLVLYQWDNKYTSLGPAGQHGVLTLTESDLENNKPILLVTGWAYYGGRLLTPADFSDEPPQPDSYMFIGEYGGLEAGNFSASPHGSVSYRITVLLPDAPRNYMLELPEIFSAYELYIGNTLAMEMGEPDPENYLPQTGNRTVSFEAGGSVDILVAVSDFSHFYSGMVYPPAFGTPETVSKMIYKRFLFRTTLCVCVLTIGLLSMLIGFLNRRTISAILFGLVCLFFIGYTCYPITNSLWGGSRLLYTVEQFSFCAMLIIIMLLVRNISGQTKKRNLAGPIFGICMCIMSLLLPLALAAGNLFIIRIYSQCVSFYEWMAAGYIIWIAACGIYENTGHLKPILCGSAAFTASLIMDRTLLLYEPILTGWFIELFSFIFVLSIGISIGQEVSIWYRDKSVLNERAGSMELLLSLQQTHYTAMQTQVKKAKTERHDMRHHFLMIDGLIKECQFDKLRDYAASFGVAVSDWEQVEHAKNSVINILAHHYAFVSRQREIKFSFRCNADIELDLSDADLCGILSNLLENAVEACERIPADKRCICIAIAQLGRMLSIEVKNSTNAGLKPSGNTFLSSKSNNRKGYGLASIRFIAQKYDGNAIFKWNKDQRLFVSHVTLIMD